MSKLSPDLRSKLKTVIDYWVEHNREHEAEFVEWADKVAASGDVERSLREAAARLNEATVCLEQARQSLDKA